MSLHFNLVTEHIDFSNAFAQADLPEEESVYLHMPPLPPNFHFQLPPHLRHAHCSDLIMKLHKSLYGQVEAPKLWYNKIKAGLETRGLKPSKIDPCLFIGSKVMALVYVDDVIFLAKDPNDIKTLRKSFVDDGDEYNWEHTYEGTINTFLGINIKEVQRDQLKGFEFTQSGLIKKILKATGMDECNGVHTPTLGTKPLGSDLKIQAAKERWSYPSIVGMLLYVAANS